MGAAGQEQFSSKQQRFVESPISVSSRAKDALARKAMEFTTADFIESRILPLLSGPRRANSAGCNAEIIQNTGTGRLTLRYAFDPENVVYAKLYDDELGRHCYEVNCKLWRDGFSNTGHYQVPEPIDFLTDHNLLLMRGVPGTPLGAAFDGNSSVDIVSGSYEAAEWLARLHRSTLCVGTPDSDWDSLKLFRMASRVIKAVVARPEKLDMVRELMETLERRIVNLTAGRSFVFTHGRYHHDHVFLSPNATIVIDLDRCRPSDPAKDAAEFIRVLRLTAFKENFDMQRVELATSRFLETYLAKVPEATASLDCYWATFVFHSLLGGLKKARNKGDKSWEQLEAFYVGEMMRALDFGR